MSQQQLTIKEDHQIVDPETGEVLDKAAYYIRYGVDPRFVIDTPEKMHWYLKERKKLESIVETTKEMYRLAVKHAEAELKEFKFHFHEDAQRVADKMSLEEGKQTVMTPYGKWVFANETKGKWQIESEDELQTWLRFLPERLEKPEVNGVTLPTKELVGAKPSIYTRQLPVIKELLEQRRQLEEDIALMRSNKIEPNKELLEKLQILKDVLPKSAIKYIPPARTCSLQFPKGE